MESRTNVGVLLIANPGYYEKVAGVCAESLKNKGLSVVLHVAQDYRKARFCAPGISPFERTLMLDADCLCLRRLPKYLWDSPLALRPAMQRSLEQRQPVQINPHWNTYNAGAIVFHKSSPRAQRFFERWGYWWNQGYPDRQATAIALQEIGPPDELHPTFNYPWSGKMPRPRPHIIHFQDVPAAHLLEVMQSHLN